MGRFAKGDSLTVQDETKDTERHQSFSDATFPTFVTGPRRSPLRREVLESSVVGLYVRVVSLGVLLLTLPGSGPEAVGFRFLVHRSGGLSSRDVWRGGSVDTEGSGRTRGPLRVKWDSSGLSLVVQSASDAH